MPDQQFCTLWNKPLREGPQCGQTDGYLNTGPGQHWFVCDKHRTKWPAPPNQFLSWQGEHHSTWKQHEVEIRSYGPVTPLPWNGPLPEDAPPTFKGDLQLVTLIVEALLSDDDQLTKRQVQAYEIAAAGQWPDRIGLGDALALFLAAAVQARELSLSSEFPHSRSKDCQEGLI